MSSLKIASMEIRDFRGIRRATIDCNADVVLMYGRNGAGKTTIFDAVEYALFGCNRRLETLIKKDEEKNWERHLPNALGDGSFDLKLLFQSGESIEVHRAAAGEENGLWVGQLTRREFIYRRLMKDITRGRRNVAAVHDLALSTHLLLQSEIAGFAASGTLDGEKLAALTGSGYIERCRGKAEEALKNARSRYKMGDAQRADLQQRRDAALSHKNRIAASLARRDELLRLARTYEIYFAPAASVNDTMAATEWSRMLSDVRVAVATTAEQLASVRALSAGPSETDDETALRDSVAMLRTLVATTESRRTTLAQQLASAREILERTTRSQVAREKCHASAEKLLSDATQLRDLLLEIPAVTAARDEATIAEGKARLGEEAAAAAAVAAAAALNEAVDLHSRLHAQRSYVTAAAAARARAASEEEQLERDITATRHEIDRLTLGAEQGRAALRAAREAFDAELLHFTNVAPDVDRLTAELEALIHSEPDCPLCGTSFGSPVALSRAIAQHAEKRTATLDALRRTVEERRRDQDRLESAASRAEVALGGAKGRLTTLEANRSRAAAARLNAAEQLSTLTNTGQDVAQTLADLSARLGTASVRVEELRLSATDASARLATSRQTLQSTSTRSTSAALALENAQRKIASLEPYVRRAAAELGVAADVKAISDFVSTLIEELRANRENATAQTRSVRDIEDALTRVSNELASAEARHEIEHRRLQEAIRRREVRTQQMALLSLPAAASGTEIDRVADITQDRHTRLRELASMISELVDIANSGTVTDLRAAEQELTNCDRYVHEAERQLKALTAVGTTLRNWEASLRQRVEAAVREFVFPRAAEIENMFRSLVADPFRFERILVDHDASHGLRLGLVFRSLSKPSGSPEFFLSAAQMSALALSIFLSLARAQKWSWLDTILLDDPVQHLDDLDCIALLDGLRNVARQSRSKQLIISTCDRSLYHHMIRKFSLASAPAESTILAIRLEEDLANGVRLHYEVDSRPGASHTAADAYHSR